MSKSPLKEFPLQQNIRRLGIEDEDEDEDESTRLIDLMIDNGLIKVRGGKNGAGVWYVMHDVHITPKGLAQMDLWPSDNERALFLLQQVVEALEGVAAETESSGGDAAKVGRFRAAARSLRGALDEASTEVVAKAISNVMTGG